MALMEKRLSEYFSVALMEDTVLKRFYDHGSFMLNEEAHILANVLTALNSVDFRYVGSLKVILLLKHIFRCCRLRREKLIIYSST